jgi:predicted outer membrane repeat protein
MCLPQKKDIKINQIKKSVQNSLLTAVLVFSILSAGALKNSFAVNVGNWSYFNSLVSGSSIFDISLISNINYLSDLTMGASSGTIRGASGANVFVLNGNNSWVGFDLSMKELHFVGNIKFDLFHGHYAGWGVMNSVYSTVSFNNSSVSFTGNSASVGGAIVAQTNSSISFNNSIVSFTGNYAMYGSAIDAEYGSSISFNNSIVSFTNNSASGGGVISASLFYDVGNSISFNNSIVSFTGNSASNFGGAFYVLDGGSSVSFNNSSVSFINNTAEKQGGTFYTQGRTISFNVIDSDIFFSGNKANGVNNDFYLSNASTVVFNIVANRAVNLGGGIQGTTGTFVRKIGAGFLNFGEESIIAYEGNLFVEEGTMTVKSQIMNIGLLDIAAGANLEFEAANSKTIVAGGKITGGGTINKTGEGDLIFSSVAVIDYRGNFNITKGIVKAPISISTISVLTISSGAKLSLAGSVLSQHILYVGSATISGVFDIGVNLSSLNANIPIDNIDMLVSSQSITITSGSFLNVSRIFGTWTSTGAVKIMQSLSLTDDIENWNLLSFDNTHYNIAYDATNKSLFLRVLSNPTILSINNSSKFIANSLSLAAQSHRLDDIYNRLDVGRQQQGNAWVGLYGSGKNIDDFSVNGFGGAIGADLYNSKNFIGGLFVRYGSNDIKEKENKGTMGEIEFGIYGGLFKISNSPINVKANLSMGIQNYSMEVGETVDFDGKSVKGGFEVEYVAPISKTTKIKPFIGIQGGLAMNDDVKGSSATIKSDSLLRAEAKLGLGISGKLGVAQNFNWFGRLYGIFLVSGDEPKYKTKDNADNESEVIGAKEGAIQGAISLGGEYQIGKSISIFANADADFGTGFGWTGGVGANYKF